MGRFRVRIEEGKLILQKKIWSFNDKALFLEFHLVDQFRNRMVFGAEFVC